MTAPASHKRIKKLLHAYERRKNSLHYTHLSVILQRAKAIRLPKNSVLYLPKDFHDLRETRMVYQGDLQGMVNQYLLMDTKV